MNDPARLMARKLCEAIENEDYQDVEMLLKGGADPNHLLPEGIAPVHLASGKERESALRCLNLILLHGGDPNARSMEDLTPLHVAASWGCSKCLKLLLKNGGDPSLQDQDGNRAIDLAFEQGNRRCAIILQDRDTRRTTNERNPDEHLQLEDSTETISLSDLTVSSPSDAGPLSSTRISLLCSLPRKAKPNIPLSDTVLASQSQHTSFLSDLEENLCHSNKTICVGSQSPPLEDLNFNGITDSSELVNSHDSVLNSSTQFPGAPVLFAHRNIENFSKGLDSLDISGREPALTNEAARHTTFATGNADPQNKNFSYKNTPKERNGSPTVSGLTAPNCMTTLSTAGGEEDHSWELSGVCPLNGASIENLSTSTLEAVSYRKEGFRGSSHDFPVNRYQGQDLPISLQVYPFSQQASDVCWNLNTTVPDPVLSASKENGNLFPDVGVQNISSNSSKYDSCHSECYISVSEDSNCDRSHGEKFEEIKANIPSEAHPCTGSHSGRASAACNGGIGAHEDLNVAAFTNQPNAVVVLTAQDVHAPQPILQSGAESSDSAVGLGELSGMAFSEYTPPEEHKLTIKSKLLASQRSSQFQYQRHKEDNVSDPNVDQDAVPTYDNSTERWDLALKYDVVSAQLKGMIHGCLPLDAVHKENVMVKVRCGTLSDEAGHRTVCSKTERDAQQRNEIVSTLPTDACVASPSSQNHSALSLELRKMMFGTKSLHSPLPEQNESPCYITARTKNSASSPSRNSSSSLFDSSLEMPKRQRRLAGPRRKYNSPCAFASPADDRSNEDTTLSQSRGFSDYSPSHTNGIQTQSLDDTEIIERKDDCPDSMCSFAGAPRVCDAGPDEASATVILSLNNDDTKSSESDHTSPVVLPGTRDAVKTGGGEADDSIPTFLIKPPANWNLSEFFTDDKSSSFTDERKPFHIQVTNCNRQPLISDTENSFSDNTWMTENGEQCDYTRSAVLPSLTCVSHHNAGLHPFGLSSAVKPQNQAFKSRNMFHSTLLDTRLSSIKEDGAPLRPRYSVSRLSSGIMSAVSTSSDKLYPIQDMPSFDITLSPGGRPISQSINEPIEYLYMDPEEGHALIERHYPGTDDSTQDSTQGSSDTIIYDWTTYKSELASPVVKGNQSLKINGKKILPELYRLSNDDIMAKLKELGENPGPITSLTRRVYLAQLDKLMKDPQRKVAHTSGYSTELTMALQTFQIPNGTEDEIIISKQFDQPDKNVKWREGVLKSSFNYLLLDPRVTRNLPCRCLNLSQAECFRTFISAIFYVGKGKRSRPYSHLYEALTHFRTSKKQACQKVQHILDIWQAGLGVVSLHCFQNAIPVEAYTREACMVDAIGLKMLTNRVKGNYYGYSQDWPMKRRRRLGVHMLHRAMQIFLAEGERQLRPADIRIGQ